MPLLGVRLLAAAGEHAEQAVAHPRAADQGLEMGGEILVDPVGEGGVVFVGVEQVAGASRQTALAVDPAYLALSRKPLVDQAFNPFEQRLDAGLRKGLPQNEKPLRGVRLLVFFRDCYHRRIDFRKKVGCEDTKLNV